MFDLYGAPAVKRYKTFVATWRPAGGAIRVVLVGGLPGTGKTTLAQGLAEKAGLSVMRSDLVRKELERLTVA